MIQGRHFDGGTITWAPLTPNVNSSSVPISITQTYSWSYPTITCTTDVPITTPGRSSENTNLACMSECGTDGGYSTKPIDILTDCTSFNSNLGMMSSQRTHNLTLLADAHFYLSYVGSAWVALGYPAVSGNQWSIVTYIDLRLRPDGIINTPPTAQVVSPQYAFVNQTIQIPIPVSDVNQGDDVRCRWSKYTPGFRRRRRQSQYQTTPYFHNYIAQNEKIHIRQKRYNSNCNSSCAKNCWCGYSSCDLTLCNGKTCKIKSGCQKTSGQGNTTTLSTTVDTPATLKSTSSYPNQQAIDECGDICYPNSVPNGTTLSNCTITFTGLVANTWYAIAVQVEDFINTTSNVSMSSVPVQFLIYVQGPPDCPKQPVIIPLDRCLEVKIGVTISFNISALYLCDPNDGFISDIIVSNGISGITSGSVTDSTTNASISYVILTWTPLGSQLGYQELCTVAYTDEFLQSNPYCVTFTVKNSSNLCVTTTTTSTTTTSTSSTSTTSSSSTSTTTSSSTSTTTSSSTSTTTSSSTSSTTSTTTTTTTTTTATTTTSTTTKAPKHTVNWLLILGLSLLALLMAICCPCFCLYWLLWGPSARRRRRKRSKNMDVPQHDFLFHKMSDLMQEQPIFNRINKNHYIDSICPSQDPTMKSSSTELRPISFEQETIVTDIDTNTMSASMLTKTIKDSNMTRINQGNISMDKRSSVNVIRISKAASLNSTNPIRSRIQKKYDSVSVIKSSRNKTNQHKLFHALSDGNISIFHSENPSIELQPIRN